MKNFTHLLESYRSGRIKSLINMIAEESTEEEFNKEIEEFKKKDAGKIRNKEISKPAVQGVKEIAEESDECACKSMTGKPRDGWHKNISGAKKMSPEERAEYHEKLKRTAKEIKSKSYTLKGGKVVEEETNLQERSLSSEEEGKKEDIVKGMKKSSKSFKKLYGDRAKSVMYATATKMAKEDFDFPEIEGDALTEEFINEWNASGHKQSKALKWIKANGFEPDRHSKHPAYKHIITGKTVTGFNTHGNEVGAEALRNTRKMIIQHHQENGIKYKEL